MAIDGIYNQILVQFGSHEVLYICVCVTNMLTIYKQSLVSFLNEEIAL